MSRPAHGTVDLDALRKEFVRLLTTDSETKDRRRRDFNQAIFNADEGWAVWSSTDLDMVMDKFEDAARNLTRRPSPDPIAPYQLDEDSEDAISAIEANGQAKDAARRRE